MTTDLNHFNSANPTAPGSLSTDVVVAELFAAWRLREQQLDEHKQKFRAAVEAYAKGTGPDPTLLMVELTEMRDDCRSVCTSLVRAIRLARER